MKKDPLKKFAFAIAAILLIVCLFQTPLYVKTVYLQTETGKRLTTYSFLGIEYFSSTQDTDLSRSLKKYDITLPIRTLPMNRKRGWIRELYASGRCYYELLEAIQTSERAWQQPDPIDLCRIIQKYQSADFPSARFGN